jgi:membrane-associated phospholipid phosphatase
MDISIYKWFNHVADHSSWLHGVARLYADYGIFLFAGLLLWAWWDARRAARPVEAVAAVAWAGAAALVGFGLVQVIGAIVDRSRPYAVWPAAHVLISRTTDSTFPSDHATAAATIAIGLWLAGRRLGSRRIGSVAIVLAVVMAVDRVYVGAHYLTDVLAGLALGALVAWGLQRAATSVLTPGVRWLASGPLSSLVGIKTRH